MSFYKRGVVILFAVLIIFFVFFLWQNNHILTTNIAYKNRKIPKEFDEFTIVQISDLHNKRFGKDQNRLLKKIEKASPDIIVITGDLIDRRKYNLGISMEFIKGSVEIAPVYYVPGNHEAWSGKYETIRKSLVDEGVFVLDDEKIDLVREDSKIDIIGLKDPDFLTSNYIDGTDISILERQLKKMSDDSTFQILLCHRPELFSLYKSMNIDLSFTGHAHGGQFRIPLLGGLVAPDQGLFPKYTSGLHSSGNSAMVVSRGLGNSIIPIRIFNRPEIIKLVLKAKE